MGLRVRFFGATADIVGEAEILLPTPGSTVLQIVDTLKADYPALSKLDLKFALDHEYVSAETEVGHADQLAIFTAVSGG